LRHAVTSATQGDIIYYDNGGGINNATWEDEVTGLAARLGITKLNSAPWSSQARGVVERFHSSVLHKAARQRPTYVGQRMDQDARRTAFKVTRAEIKATGTSRLLTSWADFIADIDAAMEAYNGRPHSFHPKIVDPTTGKRRHMTPSEVWDQAINDGWTPDPLPAEEARTLFRPAVRRKVNRALINWIGNEYFAPELEYLHGEEVMVAYDIHDAGSVSVSLLDGRYVCEAIWGGHKRAYLPVSFAQRAKEQRVAGKIQRLENHRQVALAELNPTPAIEPQPAEIFSPEILRAAEEAYARMEPPQAAPAPAAIAAPGRRPAVFVDDASWARWVMENPDQALDQDRAELRRKLRDRNFKDLLEMQGLDVGALSALAA
ncbi:MAG: Mu transposase C-terminal domain-containing protein, partial [Magnetospirillum sp.]|nr:Mu transposase C-terminal domain-containing protein [Magnetospirillum sp.]